MSKEKEYNRKQIDEELEQLESDNKSGAAEILRRAARIFALFAPQTEKESYDLERARKTIIHICCRIATAQPHMASLTNLANTVAAAARAATRAADLIESAARTARNFSQTAAHAAELAATRAADLICALNRSEPAILTHSRSSTVLEAFRKAYRAGKKFTVTVTESRPMLEGRALAEALASEGIKVNFIADAAAALIMKTNRAQMVLVGADIVKPGKLINKTGTRMIALAARERGIPVYAVCDTSKFVSSAFETHERHSEAELWPGAPQGIQVLNSYFENTPLEYFAGIVTEDGVLPPDEVELRIPKTPLDPEIEDLYSSSLLKLP